MDFDTPVATLAAALSSQTLVADPLLKSGVPQAVSEASEARLASWRAVLDTTANPSYDHLVLVLILPEANPL